jgi:hypothetical protein
MTFKRFACAVLRRRLTYRAARNEIAAFTGRRNATQMAADTVPGPVVGRIEAPLERMDMSLEAALEAVWLPHDFLDKLRLGKTWIPRGKRLLTLAEALGTSV